MISYVDGFHFWQLSESVDINRFDEIIEVVADAFAHLVEHRIDLGLYRNYVEEEENLPAVRGRILIAPDAHRNAILRHRTYCRYTTYSWDLPENQVIRDVVYRLSRWGFSRKLTGRLIALDHQMDEVSRVRFRAPDVDRFVYNRQSEDYRAIHRLCQFFLEGASLSEDVGDIAFDGFLLDMNVLFERLITKALRDRLPAPLLVRDQFHTTLDVSGRVHMRPDVVISATREHLLVADCKYKSLLDEQHRHGDLYQLLAYCTALGVRTGVLIYPRHLTEIDTRLHIRGNDIDLRELSVSLDGTPAEIMDALGTLAHRIETWSRTSHSTTHHQTI
jgi:5-methylcytosine-specific restriction enzyme subunit McrC